MFVVKPDGETVERRDVVFGIQGLDRREVVAGVEPNEKLITDGRYRLVVGVPVKLLEAETVPDLR